MTESFEHTLDKKTLVAYLRARADKIERYASDSQTYEVVQLIEERTIPIPGSHKEGRDLFVYVGTRKVEGHKAWLIKEPCGDSFDSWLGASLSMHGHIHKRDMREANVFPGIRPQNTL